METSIIVMSCWLIIVGITHFTNKKFFMYIMPPYIPYHTFMVYASGVIEIALGIMILFPETRVLAAWLLIGLFIAVYPANIYAVEKFKPKKNRTMYWLSIIRLPFQFLFIWWAWQYT